MERPTLPAGGPGTPGTGRKTGCRSSSAWSPPGGRPVAVRVFAGNTCDSTAFAEIVAVVRNKFGLRDIRSWSATAASITSVRIAALNQLEDGMARPDPTGWITALRAPAIKS